MTLEIAVFNIASAIEAEKAGADRLELCENYDNGGTTPSYGYLKTIKEKISIPCFVMIRPRGGNFFYSDDEFEIMKKDILLCKELNFQGVVFGLLNEDKTIDKIKTKQLVELAHPLKTTFHRAFDECNNPLQALEDIIECGCNRILTSGQKPSAIEGKNLLQQLIQQANERIIIMPGGGVRSNNIVELKSINTKEFHSAAVKTNQNSIVTINVEEIKKMKTLLQ